MCIRDRDGEDFLYYTGDGRRLRFEKDKDGYSCELAPELSLSAISAKDPQDKKYVIEDEDSKEKMCIRDRDRGAGASLYMMEIRSMGKGEQDGRHKDERGHERNDKDVRPGRGSSTSHQRRQYQDEGKCRGSISGKRRLAIRICTGQDHGSRKGGLRKSRAQAA